MEAICSPSHTKGPSPCHSIVFQDTEERQVQLRISCKHNVTTPNILNEVCCFPVDFNLQF